MKIFVHDDIMSRYQEFILIEEEIKELEKMELGSFRILNDVELFNYLGYDNLFSNNHFVIVRSISNNLYIVLEWSDCRDDNFVELKTYYDDNYGKCKRAKRTNKNTA